MVDFIYWLFIFKYVIFYILGWLLNAERFELTQQLQFFFSH